jgi:hypothetical protein
LANWQRRDVVGKHAIQPSRGAWAADKKFSHVGYVEDSAGLANGFVFLENARVLNWHFPTCEFDHSAAGGKVLVVEWSSHMEKETMGNSPELSKDFLYPFLAGKVFE